MDFLGYKRSKHPFCKSIPSLTTNDFSKSSPCGPIPHNLARPLIANVMQTQATHSKAVPSRIKKTGEGSDAPPTLERSGSERRGGAVTSLALLERERAWEWVKDSLFARGEQGSRKNYSFNAIFQRNNIFPIIYRLHIRFGSFINL